MGQNHAKSLPLQSSTSTGPDPTIFQSQPLPRPRLHPPPLRTSYPLTRNQPLRAITKLKRQISRDTLLHRARTSLPPQSLISIGQDDLTSPGMRYDDTTETLTHIDYNQAGELHQPSIGTMAKSRGMVRKLSQKAGFKANVPPRKPEDLVNEGTTNKLSDDLERFETLVIHAESKITTAIPTPDHRIEFSNRMTKAGTFKQRSVSEGSTSRRFPSSFAPSLSQPNTLHRRSSSSSVHSIISMQRAEREWRARVAGLAGAEHHAGSPRSPSIQMRGRGPVPPRRTPGPPLRSRTPEDDRLETPPQAYEPDDGIPIVRSPSFETLGHYAHFFSEKEEEVESEMDESGLHHRKASLRQSHLDRTLGEGTRPSSVNTLHLLAIPPSPTTRRATLPPFESFRSAPTSVPASEICPTPTQPRTPNTVEKQIIWSTERRISGPSLSGNTIAARDKTGSGFVHLNQPEQAIRTACTGNTDLMTTHLTPSKLQLSIPTSPITPLSPTSTYFLNAPIDQISWKMDEPDKPHQGQATGHPYALTKAIDQSPAPPLFPSKSPMKPTIGPLVPISSHQDSSFDPFTSQPCASRRPFGPRGRSAIDIPAALKVRATAPRVEILGSRGIGGNHTRRLNLTPGMASGTRPPKNGLPIAVSYGFLPT